MSSTSSPSSPTPHHSSTLATQGSSNTTSTPPGRIIQLELNNFKSYRGRQIIGPLKQFSCIIGPNGSGKSNLMDAISFVMGLRAQHLRSTKLSKLIYHGDDETDSSITHAWVKLIFETADGDRIEFKRQVNREGQSTYYIDNRSVNANAYDERLESFGVISKARNFLVFQGDVESIASKSPMELTKLIEKVSKSDEFKKEYDRLKLKKETASELVVQNFQKKKTVNQEKTKYKLHKKEAEEFETLAREHAKKQTTYVLWRLYHIEKHIMENRQQKAHLEEERDRQAAANVSLNKELGNEKKQHAAAKAEVMKRQNAHKKHAKAQRKLETDADQANVSLKHSQEAAEKIRKQIEDAKRSNKERQREIDQLERKIRDAEEARDAQIDALKQSATPEHEELTGDLLEEYNQLRVEIGGRTINFQEDLDRNQAILDSERQDQKQISARVQILTEKLEALQKQIDARQQRFDKIDSLVQAKSDEKDELTRKLNEIIQKQNALNDEQLRSRDELTNVRDELVDARVEEDENERDTKMNQALESMKNHFSGVYGKLNDLFNVSADRYKIPVYVALGNRNRHAIVTDTEKTAIDCIKYLKEQRVPPMVFIPLDTIQAPKLNETLRNINDTGAKLVMDVIAVKNPQYEPAMRYALGNTVLFPTMDSAMTVIQQRGKLKCVTMDGTIFSKSGFITGGKEEIEQALRATSQRSTKSEADIAQLKERRDALLARVAVITQEKHKLDKNEQSVRGDIQTREMALKFMNNDRDNAVSALEAAQNDKKQLQAKLDQEQKELTTATNNVRAAENKIAQINDDIAKVEDEVLADFNAKIGYNMRVYEQERQQRKQQMLTIQSTHNQTIARLSESLEYAKSLTKDNAAIKQLEDDLEKEMENADNLSSALKKHRDSLAESEKKAATLRKSLEDAKKDMQEQHTKINETIKKINDNHQRLQSIEKKITNVDNAINLMRNKRSHLVTQCLVEEIELPTAEDDGTESTRPKKRRRRSDTAMDVSDDDKILRSEPIEIQLAGEEDDTDDVMRDIDDTTERKRTERSRYMTLDFSGLSTEICTITSQEQYQNVEAEFKADLARLINEIEKLAPSVKSSKRYEGVKEKLNKTASDLEKAKEESKKAAQDFEEIKERRYKRFMDAFKPISKAIDDIYKELTKSEMVPLGGTAYLGLDQEDEPYLQGIKYNAMPPLKRYRDIDQLSGGERTVAALALLFAIHRYRPSPFFILDEVDAALDNVNVNKVAHYIHRAAAKQDCQFIVISLKENFFASADSLVGVCKDQEQKSSGTLTMDLSPFRAVPVGGTQRDLESDAESVLSGASGRVSRASSGHISDI